MKKSVSEPKAVSQLSPEAKAFYAKVCEQWEVVDEPGQTIVLVAAQCLSEMDKAQETLHEEGQLQADRFGVMKPHPARQVLKDSRGHFLECVRALNLDLGFLERE